MKRIFLLFVVVTVSLCAFGDLPVQADAQKSLEHARLAELHISGLDFEEARTELAAGDPDDPSIALERGRLAIYLADCDAAVSVLVRPEVAKTEEGGVLGEIARGCARVTASTVADSDAEHAVEVRYQDEGDRALTPMIVETVARARDVLTQDLGVTWPKPTRITVVRDLLSLSAMTGLPYGAAQTTGTVAVAKWGRVTLLSPRASRHGYTWRDTLAHELTHLAVTRATLDRAPLWLQEGLAKREEVRWRTPGPFDDRPSPEGIVLRGMGKKLDLPLDQLGPSIAMLPSADAAMVAFAEVTSFVRYFATESEHDSLVRLLLALRQGKSPDQSMVEASGLDLKGWNAKWHAYLLSAGHAFASPDTDSEGTPKAMADTREWLRLAELLYERAHPGEALIELDRVRSAEAADDPSIFALRARVLRDLGRINEAERLTLDPKEIAASYGPWWAIRGELARARGEQATADASFVEAVSTDPLDVASACQGASSDARPSDPSLALLCEAAHAAGLPMFSGD